MLNLAASIPLKFFYVDLFTLHKNLLDTSVACEGTPLY